MGGRAKVWTCVATVLVACVGDSSNPVDGGADADATVVVDAQEEADAKLDAGTEADVDAAPCNLSKPFNAPVGISELNTLANDAHARLTHDELNVYFHRQPNGDAGVPGLVGTCANIFVASRASTSAPFGAATNGQPLVAVNKAFCETDPSPSGDHKSLYFTATDPALVAGGFDLAVATRATAAGNFGSVTDLSINTTADDYHGYILPDELALYFASTRNGPNPSLFRASRASTASPFAVDPPTNFAAINTSAGEGFPTVMLDQLTIYFASVRTDGGAKGGNDIWKATRTSTSSAFVTPVNVSELNTAGTELPTWISDDGCRLYFDSDRNAGAGLDLFVASKPPT